MTVGLLCFSCSDSQAVKRTKLSHAQLPKAIVLDIEGTVAPISFVADVMFPYARDNVRQHLQEHYHSQEAQADIDAIRQQAADDGAAAIPDGAAGKDSVIEAVVSWVHAAIAADRKIGPLKQLQGHVWRSGFKSGKMVAQLFRDVPDAMVEWRNAGIKTYIYSSGSREAQHLFFGCSQVGDLRPYLSGFFDTTSGPKVDASSYKNILLTLGVNEPQQVLFATDVLAEAQAAQAAGWQAVLVDRPGNKPLPEEHGFRVIETMSQLLQH
jgi:methylthioribulose 1-phosphate dehydratase/enolase-phosphatase E1